MTKTLKECKDQVAQKYGAPDWWSLDFNKTNLSQEAIRDEAALLYGESKWNEACYEQRVICYQECGGFKTATQPTFKP